MIITQSLLDPRVKRALLEGKIIVARTDTIYGILTRAEDEKAVKGLYNIRLRNPEKSCIILVANLSDIPHLSKSQQNTYLKMRSLRPTTVVVFAPDTNLTHLTQADGTLAFRLVSGELAELIQQTGPLIAPSANPEGLPPAKNIKEAIDYFNEKVTVYVDGGECLENTPSQIITFPQTNNDEVIFLRK